MDRPDLSAANRSSVAASGAAPQSILDDALETLIRLILGVLVTALAARLLHSRVDPFQALLLAGVLAAAAVFGLMAGLAAAAAAQIAYHAAPGTAAWGLDLRSPDILLLAVFGATVTVIGLHADAARNRHERARSMLEAARPLSSYASIGAAERFLAFARRRTGALGRAPIQIEARRALATFSVAVAGVAAAMVLHRYIGASDTAVVALAAALIVAEQTGARFGLMAGALTAILLALAVAPLGRNDAGPLQQAVQVVLFAALAWRVGATADELRYERSARRALTGAGRDVFASADEAAVRQVLLESLQRIDPKGAFEIRNDDGELLASQNADAAASLRAPAPGFRTRRLQADGRDVGEVRWRFPGAESSSSISNEIAASVIDLGASAIVRARLTAEKTEMEYSVRAEQLRMIMLDAASHHFRTPLAGILGSVTSILNMPEPHDSRARREFLLIIKEQANRLNRYIDNFQSLARLESDAIEVNLADVDVEMLIYDVWESFGASGGSRRYFQASIDVEVVRSDSALLNQVFANVLENAVKYSREGSLVEVRARGKEDQLVIQVLDEGAGVPDVSIARMFDRFYRSPTAKAPGLGLGLYISRSLIEMLGGALSASNRTDGKKGLVVSISLPLAEAPR